MEALKFPVSMRSSPPLRLLGIRVAVAVPLTVAISAMAGYGLARVPSRFTRPDR